MKDEPPTPTNVSKRFTASAVPATNFDISAVHCYLAPRLEIIIKRNVALSSDLQDLQIDFFLSRWFRHWSLRIVEVIVF